MKRLFDVLVASALLIILGPLLLVLGLVIKAGDGGRVLYCGPRVGLGGGPFRMFKFRTMIQHRNRRSAIEATHPACIS